MGVYIKGMEMPARCEDCFCYRHNADYDYAYCNISSVNVLGNANARLNNCPLAHVPPHGRLIDEEAVIDHFVSLSNNEWNQNVSTSWANAFAEAASDICDIPTIIEAEEDNGKADNC